MDFEPIFDGPFSASPIKYAVSAISRGPAILGTGIAISPWRYAELPHALGCEGWFTARVATCGELDQALRWYRARADMGGAPDEVWFSLYQVAELEQRAGKPWPDVWEKDAAYMRLIDAVPPAAEAAGKFAGILARDAAQAVQMIAHGYRFVGVGGDVTFLTNGSKQWLELVRAPQKTG